jgi:hypothetical protein
MRLSVSRAVRSHADRYQFANGCDEPAGPDEARTRADESARGIAVAATPGRNAIGTSRDKRTAMPVREGDPMNPRNARRPRKLGPAIVLAAPLAGILAAIAALYAESGVLGILVGLASFAMLVPMTVPKRASARSTSR